MSNSYLPRLLAVSVVLMLGAAPLQAQTAPDTPAGQTIRLSPDQIEKAMNSGRKTDDDLGINGVDRGIHGEIGMSIGTHGERGAYGVAAVPLGENSGAVISFEDSRWGHR